MSDQATAKPHITEHKHGGLGQLPATAICGNDITSSCLYVSALAILAAGRWAPLSLLLVAGLLYLFRSIYSEVVGALPLNGGAYNALLNTTSKFRASIAACLTILSYMATAVLSANEAIHYLQNFWENHWSYWTVMSVTIGLLAAFMVLTIIGISESAWVAIGIFITHLSALTLLALVGAIYIARHGLSTFSTNMNTPTEFETEIGMMGLLPALFFGFSAALLGISGFESSSNFVEEQAEGVFPKTLRNMWLAVGIFNPLMALLALAVIPIANINDQNKASLLADLGRDAGGDWLSYLISADAVLVLSGAVLTSFVGVTGLVHRMALDRCLPQSLLKTNKRGTTHRIIIAFFILSVSVLLITKGELEALAGVYTFSFLAVMALFCIGNILLKVKRARLPRPVRASWIVVLLALAAVIVGLVGNATMKRPAKLFLVDKSRTIKHDASIAVISIKGEAEIDLAAGMTFLEAAGVINQSTNETAVTAAAAGETLTFTTAEKGSKAKFEIHTIVGDIHVVGGHEGVAKGMDGLSNLTVFLQYFVPALLIVAVMLGRIAILKGCLFVIRASIASLIGPMHNMVDYIRTKIKEINSQQVVFFTRGDNIGNLNNAMLYVRHNEHTNRIKIVTVVGDQAEVTDKFKQDVEFLDDAYPEIDIDLMIVEGTFGPELVDELSKKWRIPKNFMFIGSPGDHFLYGLAELGGVRLII